MDAFLQFVRLPDGSPQTPSILREFLSLQLTGDWSND